MTTFGSLFTGIGGFDLGFTRVGMTCKWQVEIDHAAMSLLERHFPDTAKYKDVRNVGGNNLEPVDVICGGFPCQDLSIAGRRAGLAGERSGLWYEFARVIDELGPRWVVIENVPGLLSSNRGRDFAVIIRWLAERGYGVAWRVLDSQYFGVAQRRRRVFIVGSLGDGRAAEVLFEREGSDRNTPARRETGEGVTGYTPSSFAEYKSGLGALRAQGGDYGGGTEMLITNALTAMYGVSVRRLTPVECERLQGFPDGWTQLGGDIKSQSDSTRYRQLGNAVTVNVIEWIGKRLLEAMQ